MKCALVQKWVGRDRRARRPGIQDRRLARPAVAPYLALFLVLGLIARSALGQGTRADYERSASLRKATENKLFKAAVKPHWFGDNSRFWYRNDLADGAYEFILVDAFKGVRRQ